MAGGGVGEIAAYMAIASAASSMLGNMNKGGSGGGSAALPGVAPPPMVPRGEGGRIVSPLPGGSSEAMRAAIEATLRGMNLPGG